MNSDMRYQDVAGVVLAGGQSRRMGKNKALLKVDGLALVDRVVRVMRSIFERVLLSTNTPELFNYLGLESHPDIFPGKGALGGVYTGLVKAQRPHAFFASCDMPFLNEDLVRFLVEAREEGTDIVLPVSEHGDEPLHAVYRTQKCRTLIEGLLEEGRLAVHGLFPLVNMKRIGPETLRQIDPGLKSFWNLNTPEELERACAIAEKSEDVRMTDPQK